MNPKLSRPTRSQRHPSPSLPPQNPNAQHLQSPKPPTSSIPLSLHGRPKLRSASKRTSHRRLLPAAPFALGSHSGCQLHFDANRYPEIAGRHCDIALDKRNFVLQNRSREGTYVNDSPVHHSIILQAGDWIRLGAAGPTVRFLGQPPQRGKATTA